MGLPDGRKSFEMGLAVVCHPATHVAVAYTALTTSRRYKLFTVTHYTSVGNAVRL